jgi:hypothetical protein
MGDGGHNYVGTEAVEVPDEVMNKILNSHTGVQMINLRTFPLSDAIDVIADAATLPLEERVDDQGLRRDDPRALPQGAQFSSRCWPLDL